MQGPVIIGNFKEKASVVKAANSRRSANPIHLTSPVSGCVLLPQQRKSDGQEIDGLKKDELEIDGLEINELEGIPDDNR